MWSTCYVCVGVAYAMGIRADLRFSRQDCNTTLQESTLGFQGFGCREKLTATQQRHSQTCKGRILYTTELLCLSIIHNSILVLLTCFIQFACFYSTLYNSVRICKERFIFFFSMQSILNFRPESQCRNTSVAPMV